MTGDIKASLARGIYFISTAVLILTTTKSEGGNEDNYDACYSPSPLLKVDFLKKRGSHVTCKTASPKSDKFPLRPPPIMHSVMSAEMN